MILDTTNKTKAHHAIMEVRLPLPNSLPLLTVTPRTLVTDAGSAPVNGVCDKYALVGAQ
jgi:hypothetical protein